MPRSKSTDPPLRDTVGPLRIIGGSHRGRKLQYSGDPRTRPMKERVRESVFNLVGPAVRGTHALDLFAGTGALGFEALSRGATHATFYERHFPTADLIRANAAELGFADASTVVAADTFIQFRRGGPEAPPGKGVLPWVVFCSPPYAFYADRREAMLTLIERVTSLAPAGSVLVVEADEQFDFAQLGESAAWDVRTYRPAVVGLRAIG
ncbi:MAG TPA: RsmD family RNA methyltransferase [Pirellulales bacterium]|jgi:16S rRNA (guanine966-N2)-methyltransferase|nr:RsmD family RNA methyltransferase [Pirellulales bacterium]